MKLFVHVRRHDSDLDPVYEELRSQGLQPVNRRSLTSADGTMHYLRTLQTFKVRIYSMRDFTYVLGPGCVLSKHQRRVIESRGGVEHGPLS